MLDKKLKIFVAGHKGLVGSAIHRKLLKEGYENIVTRSSKELDLRDQAMVNKFFEIEKPDLVFLAAAKVGGIHANNVYRGQFLYDNLMIQTNIIHASYVNQVQKLLFLGSSCIYPKHAHQPMSESELLTGVLEKTNEPYAIAKIAGMKMCEAYRAQYGCNFISAMPTNLYGLNDNYDLANSHVLPALIRKIHQAKKQNDPNVVIWGTGKPLREFLHVDDLADACLFLMEKYNEADFVNVGVGEEISILDLTILIKRIIGYEGEIINDLTKPDGTPRKLMSVDKISALGWKAKISLEEGIRGVYNSLENETWY
jgi:GDP-L-fucose synthase